MPEEEIPLKRSVSWGLTGVRKGSGSQFYDHIKAAIIFLDLFYDPVVGKDPVPGLVAPGHRYSWIDDVAVAAGSGALDDLNPVAGLDQAWPLHFERFCTHEMISSLSL